MAGLLGLGTYAKIETWIKGMRDRVRKAVDTYLACLGRAATQEEKEKYARSTQKVAAIETEIKELPAAKRHLVTASYQEVLGRAPTPIEMADRLGLGTYAKINTWLTGMRNRVQAAVDSSLTYLGREATQEEKEGYAKDVSLATAAKVTAKIKELPEAKRHLVTTSYQEALGRAPTPIEMADRLGLGTYAKINTWLKGMGDRVQAAVETSLAALGRAATQEEKEKYAKSTQTVAAIETAIRESAEGKRYAVRGFLTEYLGISAPTAGDVTAWLDKVDPQRKLTVAQIDAAIQGSPEGKRQAVGGFLAEYVGIAAPTAGDVTAWLNKVDPKKKLTVVEIEAAIRESPEAKRHAIAATFLPAYVGITPAGPNDPVVTAWLNRVDPQNTLTVVQIEAAIRESPEGKRHAVGGFLTEYVGIATPTAGDVTDWLNRVDPQNTLTVAQIKSQFEIIQVKIAGIGWFLKEYVGISAPTAGDVTGWLNRVDPQNTLILIQIEIAIRESPEAKRYAIAATFLPMYVGITPAGPNDPVVTAWLNRVDPQNDRTVAQIEAAIRESREAKRHAIAAEFLPTYVGIEAPTAADVTGWLNRVDPQNNRTVAQIEAAIQESPEALALLIANYYQVYLGREASPQEIQNWLLTNLSAAEIRDGVQQIAVDQGRLIVTAMSRSGQQLIYDPHTTLLIGGADLPLSLSWDMNIDRTTGEGNSGSPDWLALIEQKSVVGGQIGALQRRLARLEALLVSLADQIASLDSEILAHTYTTRTYEVKINDGCGGSHMETRTETIVDMSAAAVAIRNTLNAQKDQSLLQVTIVQHEKVSPTQQLIPLQAQDREIQAAINQATFEHFSGTVGAITLSQDRFGNQTQSVSRNTYIVIGGQLKTATSSVMNRYKAKNGGDVSVSVSKLVYTYTGTPGVADPALTNLSPSHPLVAQYLANGLPGIYLQVRSELVRQLEFRTWSIGRDQNMIDHYNGLIASIDSKINQVNAELDKVRADSGGGCGGGGGGSSCGGGGIDRGRERQLQDELSALFNTRATHVEYRNYFENLLVGDTRDKETLLSLVAEADEVFAEFFPGEASLWLVEPDPAEPSTFRVKPGLINPITGQLFSGITTNVEYGALTVDEVQWLYSVPTPEGASIVLTDDMRQMLEPGTFDLDPARFIGKKGLVTIAVDVVRGDRNLVFTQSQWAMLAGQPRAVLTRTSNESVGKDGRASLEIYERNDTFGLVPTQETPWLNTPVDAVLMLVAANQPMRTRSFTVDDRGNVHLGVNGKREYVLFRGVAYVDTVSSETVSQGSMRSSDSHRVETRTFAQYNYDFENLDHPNPHGQLEENAGTAQTDTLELGFDGFRKRSTSIQKLIAVNGQARPSEGTLTTIVDNPDSAHEETRVFLNFSYSTGDESADELLAKNAIGYLTAGFDAIDPKYLNEDGRFLSGLLIEVNGHGFLGDVDGDGRGSNNSLGEITSGIIKDQSFFIRDGREHLAHAEQERLVHNTITGETHVLTINWSAGAGPSAEDPLGMDSWLAAYDERGRQLRFHMETTEVYDPRVDPRTTTLDEGFSSRKTTVDWAAGPVRLDTDNMQPVRLPGPAYVGATEQTIGFSQVTRQQSTFSRADYGNTGSPGADASTDITRTQLVHGSTYWTWADFNNQMFNADGGLNELAINNVGRQKSTVEWINGMDKPGLWAEQSMSNIQYDVRGFSNSYDYATAEHFFLVNGEQYFNRPGKNPNEWTLTSYTGENTHEMNANGLAHVHTTKGSRLFTRYSQDGHVVGYKETVTTDSDIDTSKYVGYQLTRQVYMQLDAHGRVVDMDATERRTYNWQGSGPEVKKSGGCGESEGRKGGGCGHDDESQDDVRGPRDETKNTHKYGIEYMGKTELEMFYREDSNGWPGDDARASTTLFGVVPLYSNFRITTGRMGTEGENARQAPKYDLLGRLLQYGTRDWSRTRTPDLAGPQQKNKELGWLSTFHWNYGARHGNVNEMRDIEHDAYGNPLIASGRITGPGWTIDNKEWRINGTRYDDDGRRQSASFSYNEQKGKGSSAPTTKMKTTTISDATGKVIEKKTDKKTSGTFTFTFTGIIVSIIMAIVAVAIVAALFSGLPLMLQILLASVISNVLTSLVMGQDPLQGLLGVFVGFFFSFIGAMIGQLFGLGGAAGGISALGIGPSGAVGAVSTVSNGQLVLSINLFEIAKFIIRSSVFQAINILITENDDSDAARFLGMFLAVVLSGLVDMAFSGSFNLAIFFFNVFAGMFMGFAAVLSKKAAESGNSLLAGLIMSIAEGILGIIWKIFSALFLGGGGGGGGGSPNEDAINRQFNKENIPYNQAREDQQKLQNFAGPLNSDQQALLDRLDRYVAAADTAIDHVKTDRAGTEMASSWKFDTNNLQPNVYISVVDINNSFQVRFVDPSTIQDGRPVERFSVNVQLTQDPNGKFTGQVAGIYGRADDAHFIDIVTRISGKNASDLQPSLKLMGEGDIVFEVRPMKQGYEVPFAKMTDPNQSLLLRLPGPDQGILLPTPQLFMDARGQLFQFQSGQDGRPVLRALEPGSLENLLATDLMKMGQNLSPLSERRFSDPTDPSKLMTLPEALKAVGFNPKSDQLGQEALLALAGLGKEKNPILQAIQLTREDSKLLFSAVGGDLSSRVEVKLGEIDLKTGELELSDDLLEQLQQLEPDREMTLESLLKWAGFDQVLADADALSKLKESLTAAETLEEATAALQQVSALEPPGEEEDFEPVEELPDQRIDDLEAIAAAAAALLENDKPVNDFMSKFEEAGLERLAALGPQNPSDSTAQKPVPPAVQPPESAPVFNPVPPAPEDVTPDAARPIPTPAVQPDRPAGTKTPVDIREMVPEARRETPEVQSVSDVQQPAAPQQRQQLLALLQVRMVILAADILRANVLAQGLKINTPQVAQNLRIFIATYFKPSVAADAARTVKVKVDGVTLTGSARVGDLQRNLVRAFQLMGMTSNQKVRFEFNTATGRMSFLLELRRSAENFNRVAAFVSVLANPAGGVQAVQQQQARGFAGLAGISLKAVAEGAGNSVQAQRFLTLLKGLRLVAQDASARSAQDFARRIISGDAQTISDFIGAFAGSQLLKENLQFKAEFGDGGRLLSADLVGQLNDAGKVKAVLGEQSLIYQLVDKAAQAHLETPTFTLRFNTAQAGKVQLQTGLEFKRLDPSGASQLLILLRGDDGGLRPLFDRLMKQLENVQVQQLGDTVSFEKSGIRRLDLRLENLFDVSASKLRAELASDPSQLQKSDEFNAARAQFQAALNRTGLDKVPGLEPRVKVEVTSDAADGWSYHGFEFDVKPELLSQLNQQETVQLRLALTALKLNDDQLLARLGPISVITVATPTGIGGQIVTVDYLQVDLVLDGGKLRNLVAADLPAELRKSFPEPLADDVQITLQAGIEDGRVFIRANNFSWQTGGPVKTVSFDPRVGTVYPGRPNTLVGPADKVLPDPNVRKALLPGIPDKQNVYLVPDKERGLWHLFLEAPPAPSQKMPANAGAYFGSKQFRVDVYTVPNGQEFMVYNRSGADARTAMMVSKYDGQGKLAGVGYRADIGALRAVLPSTPDRPLEQNRYSALTAEMTQRDETVARTEVPGRPGFHLVVREGSHLRMGVLNSDGVLDESLFYRMAPDRAVPASVAPARATPAVPATAQPAVLPAQANAEPVRKLAVDTAVAIMGGDDLKTSPKFAQALADAEKISPETAKLMKAFAAATTFEERNALIKQMNVQVFAPAGAFISEYSENLETGARGLDVYLAADPKDIQLIQIGGKTVILL
ncbi:MAG: hypothetical protein Q7J69_00370, partial [Candidatus Omnitrophota bacterium]|nr:hypothetical protein [Candidatus Omnitrophota bacterium]